MKLVLTLVLILQFENCLMSQNHFDSLNFVPILTEYKIIYRPDSSKICEGFIDKQNRKQLEWTFYSTDGKWIKSKKCFINDSLDGISINFYSNGIVSESCNYVKGKECGWKTEYFTSGCIKSKYYYPYNIKDIGYVYHFYACKDLNSKPPIKFFSCTKGNIPIGKGYRYNINGEIKEIYEFDVDGNIINTESR